MKNMKARIYFLDNLRTMMIILVIVLHSMIGYAPVLENMWIVSNPAKNDLLGLFVIYLDIFIMFIMFFISGYFVSPSYNNRTTRAFIISKFKRIMIPWMVAVFTLIPAYKFIFLYSRNLPQEEWFTYFHLFTRDGGKMGFFADDPTQSWLWFLPVLFLFQILYILLAKTRILKIKISLKAAAALTFVVGLTYSMIIAVLNLNGWFDSPVLHFQKERLLIYFLFFLLGSLCFKLKVFESSRKNRGYLIISYITLSLSIIVFTKVALNFFANIMDPSRNIYLISEFADGLMYYCSVLVAAYSFLYVFIHIFRNKLNTSGLILGHMSRNSYAVYIIHMIVIGLFSLLLLNISIPALLKFSIVVIMTVIVSNLVISVYRTVLGKIPSKPILSLAILPIVILLSIIIYAQEEEQNTVEQQQISTMGIPAMSIHAAAIQGNIDVIMQHITAGSDVNAPEPSAGSTPLITASLFGKTEVVKALLNAGADVNFRNKDGSTALHTAAFFCYPEIVKVLLENGSDKNIRNNAGSTPLESVQAPFEAVQGIYDYFANTRGPLGLVLDYDELRTTRPIIVDMLKDGE